MRKTVVVALLAALQAGCATVVRGTSEQMAFDTVPSGAEVRVVLQYPQAGGETDTPPPGMGCVTPCVLQVKRADKLAVSVSKPGFEPESFSIAPQVSGEGAGAGILGNAVIGGVIGAGVDALSGATLDHCPNPVRIALRPLPPPARAAARPRASPDDFGYDAPAACKEQTAAKYKAVENAARVETPP